MFTGLRQLGIIIAAIALVLLGLIFIPRRRRVFERLLGIDYPLGENSLESSLGLGNLQHASAEGLYEAVTSDDCDLLEEMRRAESRLETVRPEAVRTKRNLTLSTLPLWHAGNATRQPTPTPTPKPSPSPKPTPQPIVSLTFRSSPCKPDTDPAGKISLRAESFDGLSQVMCSETGSRVLPEVSDISSKDDRDAKRGLLHPVSCGIKEVLHEDENEPHDDEKVPHSPGAVPCDRGEIPHYDEGAPCDSGEMLHDDRDVPCDDGEIVHDTGEEPYEFIEASCDRGESPHCAEKISRDREEVPHDSEGVSHGNEKVSHDHEEVLDDHIEVLCAHEEDAGDEEHLPVQDLSQETEGPKEARPIFLNRLTESPFRLREGGSQMLNLEKYSRVQAACLKVEKVVGHGSKQVLLEETQTIAGIKIVEIIPSLTNIRSVVKDGKVIIQGTVHKQIFYIGTDGLEHHLAEDMDFSELIDIEPLNPMYPVREGMNQQDFSIIENNVFEFDPDTGALTQKIILRLCVKVTETEQIQVATCPDGMLIKARVVVGENTKQKFIEESTVIDAIKVIEIVPRISQIRHTVKNGKVLVQGVVHKQIFYVGTDDLVHHLSEDIAFSDLVVVEGACEGMHSQDHSFVDNLVFEFDPATGTLIQKIILALSVKVTETCAVPVRIDECGTLITADQIIGFGCAQKLIEETNVLPAVKIVDIDARISEIGSIVKNGKVIVQGVVHKQIFFVGTDDLVHHVSEDLPFSEMIEVPALNPEFPVEEGMDQQDHSFIENIVWEFDPATGELTEKVIIGIQVVVTNHVQIPVLVSSCCPGKKVWTVEEGCCEERCE